MASLKEAAVWSFVPKRWYSCEQDSADVVSTQLAATIKPPEVFNKTIEKSARAKRVVTANNPKNYQWKRNPTQSCIFKENLLITLQIIL